MRHRVHVSIKAERVRIFPYPFRAFALQRQRNPSRFRIAATLRTGRPVSCFSGSVEFSVEHLSAKVADRKRHLPIMIGKSKRGLMFPILVNAIAPSATLMQLFW